MDGGRPSRRYGEGIDYGLETGRLAADFLSAGDTAAMSRAWPVLLRTHFSRGFSVARRLGLLLTLPRLLPMAGPIGMRSPRLMDVMVRVMGNLITGGRRLGGPFLAARRRRIPAAGSAKAVQLERFRN